jgi:hypothetical protein
MIGLATTPAKGVIFLLRGVLKTGSSPGGYVRACPEEVARFRKRLDSSSAKAMVFGWFHGFLVGFSPILLTNDVIAERLI